MGTRLYWIDGPWPGKLAVAARPRGGDWLENEIAGWHSAGIKRVLSLLTAEEERELDLSDEGDRVTAQGMKFTAFPILDLGVPNSETEMTAVVEEIDADLAAGKNVVVHCRGGIGRSGLLASCLLIARGESPKKAMAKASEARGVPVPES